MYYCDGKKPDAVILKIYDVDDSSQGYAQIEEVYRALTKDDILQPYKTDDDFTSSNTGFLKLFIIYTF